MQEIKFQRTALAFQEQILASHVIYLCGNPCTLSLRGGTPSEKDKANYSTIKEYWVDRNMDGWRTKAVRSQLATGDAGLLFYYDYKGRIKCRLISYEDGYVIISHNDNNGDRLLESVYYADADGVEYIDSYDDTYMYRMHTPIDGEEAGDDGFVRERPILHGFSEIPLCTKRGNVAWNNGQSLIEIYEIIYNIFFVIQKRNGWGILYIKGNLSETTKKLAGSIILQDKSMDGNGSAEFKAPPSPQGMLDSLQDLFEKIQINTSCTFLLPIREIFIPFPGFSRYDVPFTNHFLSSFHCFFVGFPCFPLRKCIAIPLFHYATFCFRMSDLLNTSVSGDSSKTVRLVIIVCT